MTLSVRFIGVIHLAAVHIYQPQIELSLKLKKTRCTTWALHDDPRLEYFWGNHCPDRTCTVWAKTDPGGKGLLGRGNLRDVICA